MPLNKFDTSVLKNPDDVSVKPKGVFNTSVLGTPDYEDMTPELQAYAELQHEADLNKRSYFERVIDLGGHLISGAKRAPGDVIRGTAMNVKDFYKPENPDDLFYETQFSIMTPTERARVAQRANRNIELGMDPKTAKEDALNESLQEKHEHANVIADAMMKVADSKMFQPLPGYEHPETFMQGVAGALGQQIVRLPLMLFPATRLAAIPVMQMEIAGYTYQHLIEEGVEPDRAKVAANMSAMAQTPLEFLGDLVAVKAILGPRAWKNYVSGIARTMGTEGAEEFAQQYPDAMATLWAMNPDVTLKDMWEEVSSRETFREALYAGAIGAVTGGIVAGGGIGVREGWNKYVTKKQQTINDQRTGTLLGALTKMRLGEKLTDEENTALDQAMTSLPMDAVNRLRFQSPIESDGRTTVFEGMRQILPDPVQHEKVMAILDSMAHSYAEITGKDPEDFYEDELIGAEKTTLEEFQKGVELDMAAQGRTQFQSGEEYGKEGAVTSKKGPGEKPTEATPKPEGGEKVFYRGTTSGSTERIESPFAKDKLFVSSDKKLASAYGENIEIITAKPDAKILYEGTPEFKKVFGKKEVMGNLRKGELYPDGLQRAVNAAESAGYDAVHFSQQGNVGTVILNEKAFNRNQPFEQSRPPEMGGKTALSDIGESPKGIPARKTPPIITTEQKKRQAKAKAVKEQQLKVESAEDAKKAVHSMIRERRYRLNLATYESNLFINEIERSTSREQREVIPFIIENTDVPKGLNRPDLEKIHAAEKANLAPIARQVKDHFDKGWQKMKESTPDMSAEQIEDYVTHIWDIPKGKKREVTSWFTTQNRFLKKRFIETINEGVEKFGLQPKTLDISEIIRIHDSVMNRVIENNRFVEDLKKLRKDGVPLIERADKAPQDWAYFDHPALRRGLIIPGEAKMGEKVSPELADILAEMGVAIGRRISPVTFGKPTWKAGEYRPGDTPEVRFQRFMSNRTIAHEIGHHLDATLGLGDKFLNKYKTELYEVNRKRIESFAGTDKEAYAKSTEEQIAEFFAILFTNPDLASKVAPTATADALTRLKGDGIMTKLAGFDFEKNAKNLIEERLDTMVKLPVKVHPDLEAPLKVIFESRMTHPAIQAYETMNGILKKTELSLSLFHHVALGETGIGTMGLPKTLGIYFNPVKIFKAMWRGEYDIYKKEPIARDAIEHGLQVGATSDIPVNMIQTKLNDMARKTRNVLVINKATAFLRTFNEQWDKALWNYLHDTLKLQGYESLCAKMDPTKDIKAQKEEIAQFVNDTFGGQIWDVLMVSPKSLQLMSWFLLSPDWTLSTLRQALAPTGIGTIHKEAGSALRKKMGAHFWIKAGLYFGLGINMLNYMNRKRDEKEHPEYYEGEERGFFDRTMAGNAIGHKTHLFAGRYDDGTERYVRWGKQFRELPEMFFDDTGFSPISATIKKIGGKMAPALQLASSILTGSSLSGFRNDDINGKEGWDKVYGIAKTILKSPLPFSSRTMFDENKEFHATDLAMPSSKGMTRYRSMELFKVAVAKGDERMLKEVYQDTLRNNLPAYTLFNASLAQLKAESTKEYNEGLKSIADIQERAKQVETPLEAARLARIMKRMIKENADRMAGMKLLDAAILNLRKYQILNEAEAGSKK